MKSWGNMSLSLANGFQRMQGKSTPRALLYTTATPGAAFRVNPGGLADGDGAWKHGGTSCLKADC